MAKRGAELIGDFLKGIYPEHKHLIGDVAALAEGGLTRLDDLGNVPYRKLRMSSWLLRFALRDYVQGGCTSQDLSETMSLVCSQSSVTLLKENEITQLPSQFSAMFPEDGEAFEVAKTETNGDAASEGEAAEEMRYIKEAADQIPRQASPGLLTADLYTFTTERSRKALRKLWCKTNASCILGRPCYAAVLERMERLWNAGVIALLLLGVPGIGKTGFLITLLLKLLKRRKAVVFQTKGGSRYFYEPKHANETALIGEDYSCSLLDDPSVLDDPEVYYLVDGKMQETPEFDCKTLLAAIPKLSDYQEYAKDGRGAQLFLPVWSASEIALAWQVAFDPSLPDVPSLPLQAAESKVVVARKELTLEVVKERFARWGGSARFVLEQPHVDLDTILQGLHSIQQTVETVGKQVADWDHPSHKLVHQRVKPGYEEYEYMFSSPYTVRAATEKLKQSASGQLRQFLSFKGLAAHGVNGCKGYVFQQELMSLAERSSSEHRFKVRRVEDDKSVVHAEAEQSFTFGAILKVKDLEAVTQPWPVNRIIWPESPVEETVDALLLVQPEPPGPPELVVFQATLSSGWHKHGLNYSAMLQVMGKFGIPPSRTRVYIATTSELFPEAGFQNWRKARNLVLKDEKVLTRLAGITQFALDTGI